MTNKNAFKGKRKRRWIWLLVIVLAMTVVAPFIDSGCKLRFSTGFLHPFGTWNPIVVDDSTDLWVLSYGFLDYDFEVLLAQRWSFGTKIIMEAHSEYHAQVEILSSRDGQLFALRYGDWIVDHYDLQGQHPEQGPRGYTYRDTVNPIIPDENRQYDKQVKEWLGPDYKVVWKMWKFGNY